MSETQNSRTTASRPQGIDVAPMSHLRRLRPGVDYIRDPVTGQYEHTPEGSRKRICATYLKYSNEAMAATEVFEPWSSRRPADTVVGDLLARVGLAQLHDISNTTKSISDKDKEQAKATHRIYQDILGPLATEVDSVVDPTVLATSLAKIGQSVELHQMLPGWKGKIAFWERKIESCVDRNQLQDSRASNAAPTLTVTEASDPSEDSKEQVVNVSGELRPIERGDQARDSQGLLTSSVWATKR